MGRRPSPLMQRWKTQKARKRRSSYFARGLQTKGKDRINQFVMGTDASAYNKHASQRRHRELCKLFKLPRAMFMPESEPSDPLLAVQEKIDRLYWLNNDDKTRYLRFTFVFLEGNENTDYSLSLHFQGQEFFLVERLPATKSIRRSTIHSSKENLLFKFKRNTLTWAGHVLIE